MGVRTEEELPEMIKAPAIKPVATPTNVAAGNVVMSKSLRMLLDATPSPANFPPANFTKGKK